MNTKAEPSVMTLDEAAADLGVKRRTVWAWHRQGLLALLYTKNVGADPSKRGPRKAKVDRQEWERFKREVLTVRIVSSSEEQQPNGPRRGRPKKGVDPVPPGGKSLVRGQWKR